MVLVGMEINAHVIGIRVKQIISQDQEASVTGVTSRGSFISTSYGAVLFLSREIYRGPLTLNLNSKEEIFERINPGDSICIQDRRLFFPGSSILITVNKAEEWKPSNPSTTVLSPNERNYRINTVSQKISAKSKVFSPVRLDRLRSAIISGNGTNIVHELELFLGLGTGLTPSGDDLIIGILLSLNRWGGVLYPYLSMERINQSIIKAAYQRTTALSASLIECAAQAQADERLILALDCLLTSRPDLETCIDCLRNYGSSSGEDTFLGMKLVLT